MKIVKVCPECKKYNNYKLYECVFCGANLNDDTSEVNDEEMELKLEIKSNPIEETPITDLSVEVEQEEKNNKSTVVRICPMCGSEENELWCKNCGMFLEDAEISIATKDEIKELKFNESSNIFALERNRGLESIINDIYQTFDGQDMYDTIEEKAANFLYLIVKNHVFIDGNKRIAASIFLYFLYKNNLAKL